jgi:hypothetical protein
VLLAAHANAIAMKVSSLEGRSPIAITHPRPDLSVQTRRL